MVTTISESERTIQSDNKPDYNRQYEWSEYEQIQSLILAQVNKLFILKNLLASFSLLSSVTEQIPKVIIILSESEKGREVLSDTGIAQFLAANIPTKFIKVKLNE